MRRAPGRHPAGSAGRSGGPLRRLLPSSTGSVSVMDPPSSPSGGRLALQPGTAPRPMTATPAPATAENATQRPGASILTSPTSPTSNRRARHRGLVGGHGPGRAAPWTARSGPTQGRPPGKDYRSRRDRAWPSARPRHTRSPPARPFLTVAPRPPCSTLPGPGALTTRLSPRPGRAATGIDSTAAPLDARRRVGPLRGRPDMTAGHKGHSVKLGPAAQSSVLSNKMLTFTRYQGATKWQKQGHRPALECRGHRRPMGPCRPVGLRRLLDRRRDQGPVPSAFLRDGRHGDDPRQRPGQGRALHLVDARRPGRTSCSGSTRAGAIPPNSK